jgi:hypothetical protein
MMQSQSKEVREIPLSRRLVFVFNFISVVYQAVMPPIKKRSARFFELYVISIKMKLFLVQFEFPDPGSDEQRQFAATQRLW